MSYYIVLVASTSARHKRVAVVETDLPIGKLPKAISIRAKGVKRIVQTWDQLTAGAAYRRALHEANKLADKLNGVDEDGE